MAKNWTLTEAVSTLNDGTDKAARQDIAKRYPLLATASIDEIIAAIPDKVSARMIETRLADDVGDVDDSDDAKETATEKKSKAAGLEPKPWSELTQYEKKKARKAGAEFVAKCKALDDEDDDFDDEDEEEKPVKKSAAKSTKAAKSKKPADDDDFDDFDDDEDDDDDFDDEDEEEKPVKKAAKKLAAKSAKSKKAAKKPDDEDDDFDDDDDDDLDDF